MSLILNSDGRQSPLVARVYWEFGDIDGTNFTPIFELPADAVIISGALALINSTNVANISIGDQVFADDSLLQAQAGATTGVFPFDGSDAGGREIGETKAYGISASVELTQGKGSVFVEYIRTGRAHSTQG